VRTDDSGEAAVAAGGAAAAPSAPAELVEVARRAVELALAKGAQETAAGTYRARHVEVVFRDGRLEKVSEATTRGLGLDLYVDGRYASVATSDLRPDAVERFVEDAVTLTRKLSPDPYRRLPDPELYGGQVALDLELVDPAYAGVTADERRRLAQAAEAGTRSVKGAEAILSSSASFGDTFSERFQVHSNGFEGAKSSTDFWIGAEVSARDPDGRRPEDWSAAGGRFFASLPPPEEVGRDAAARALSRLGSRKAESAVMPMLVDHRSSGRLLAYLLGPLAAASLQQKRSFLDGKLGQQIGSERLHLDDDPLVPRGLGSRRFDGEGLAARRFAVFDGGRLASYYVDTYYGRKLSMRPTTARMSNLAWRLGDRSQAELIRDMGEGILVTGFLGGNSNGTTGDFSLGAQGFRVRGGQVAEPVAEMNVSGNHLDLWQRLVAAGNDPYRYSPARTPSLLFEAVQFAGL
jgi:PmbA protein